jgi:hypothetical protein
VKKQWHRKKAVQERYGDVCSRTIDRAVGDGRLPAPHYPFSNKIPYWDGDELDAHDRAAALKTRPNGSDAADNKAKAAEGKTEAAPRPTTTKRAAKAETATAAEVA